MSVVQPPRKRKCYLYKSEPTATLPDSPSCGSSDLVSPVSAVPTTPVVSSAPSIASKDGLTLSLSSPSTITVPPDEAFAAFIKHALELATTKHSREQVLAQERDVLSLKLSATEEKLRSLQQQLQQTPTITNGPSLSPKSSPTSTVTEDKPEPLEVKPTQHPLDPRLSTTKLEQKNRELHRNLDLLQRDFNNCSNMLSASKSDCSKKEQLIAENTKEIDRLRGELNQTRLRLDAFVKSASEQALLAKSLQEELNQEKEARLQVEAKLRSANECVMLGMQFEARLKTISSEKLELDAELAKLRAENARLIASCGSSSQQPQQLQQQQTIVATVVAEKTSQAVQTDEVIAKERFIKSDEEISRLQNEIDGLQHQLSVVISADAKLVSDQLEIITQSSTSTAPGGDSSEVPSSPTQLQTENSYLRRQVADLLEELEKRKTTMEYHHKTWVQKCDQVTRLEEKVRDRDIQCAKYHYELEVAEKRIRTMSDKLYRAENSLSSNSSPSFLGNLPQERVICGGSGGTGDSNNSNNNFTTPCEF